MICGKAWTLNFELLQVKGFLSFSENKMRRSEGVNWVKNVSKFKKHYKSRCRFWFRKRYPSWSKAVNVKIWKKSYRLLCFLRGFLISSKMNESKQKKGGGAVLLEVSFSSRSCERWEFIVVNFSDVAIWKAWRDAFCSSCIENLCLPLRLINCFFLKYAFATAAVTVIFSYPFFFPRKRLLWRGWWLRAKEASKRLLLLIAKLLSLRHSCYYFSYCFLPFAVSI